jgi:hypothetical protein
MQFTDSRVDDPLDVRMVGASSIFFPALRDDRSE